LPSSYLFPDAKGACGINRSAFAPVHIGLENNNEKENSALITNDGSKRLCFVYEYTENNYL
jgi:hypothetical protein